MTDLHLESVGPGRVPLAATDDTDLLERVREVVVELLAAVPRSPARLRIRAHDVELELDWAASTTGSVRVEPVPEPAGPQPPVPSGRLVTAPTVGTFYRCPEPGSDPFVQVGDQVRPGQQVAIIEAMKLMLPVEADTAAVITQVLVEDGQSVEYGQPLFALDPRT